jgi:hypothetical protein
VTFNRLTVTKEQLAAKNCGQRLGSYRQSCILLLSLCTADSQVGSNDDAQIAKESFTITVTAAELVQLQERVPVLDVVGEKLVKYYSFYVSDAATTILVALTSVGEGDPDLAVSKGIDARPTMDDANWISQNPNVDYIVISKQSNSTRGRFKPIDNTTGFYVVAVYGYHRSQYSLTYTTGDDFKMLTALANSPVSIVLPKRGQAIYLTYYHYSHEGFSVLLSKVTGSAEIAVTLMPQKQRPGLNNSDSSSNDFIKQLPHPTQQPVLANGTKVAAYWTSHYQGNKDQLLVSSESAGFCMYCEYIIGIFAKSANTVMTATVQIEGHYQLLQSNRPQQDYVGAGQQNLYHFFANKNFKLIVTLLSGSVQVYVQLGYIVSNTSSDQYVIKGEGDS